MAKGYHGGKSRKRNMLGLQLDRESATLPLGTFGALFNIVGGRVVLTSIVGEVTVVLAGGAFNMKITSDPTTGTNADIATDLACGSDVVGTLYGIDAYVGAMLGGVPGATAIPEKPIVLPIGELGITPDQTRTGEIKWSITYYPYDDNAYMEVV